MQLMTKHIEQQKKEFIEYQDGKCAICNNELDKDLSKVHLDHSHDLFGENAGKCRGALCMFCNRLEGDIKKKFAHSGLATRNVEQIEWLESLIKYLKTDLSKRNIHPQHVTDYAKWFSNLNKPDMIDELKSIGVDIPPKSTRESLYKLFRKEFRKYQYNTFNEYHEVIYD